MWLISATMLRARTGVNLGDMIVAAQVLFEMVTDLVGELLTQVVVFI